MLVSSSIIQYEIVDPYILDVIKALNRLPQVHMTYYSCAGVGPVGQELHKTGKKKGHRKNEVPYIGLGYRAEADWYEVDELLCSVGFWKRPTGVGFLEECEHCGHGSYKGHDNIQGAAFYYYKNYDPRSDTYEYYSKKQIKRMWDKLRAKLQEKCVL